MFFEGAEKKLEIIVNDKELLWNFDDHFWDHVVEKSKASIISSIRNNDVRAYLLSESSLFVWRDRLLMLTCGETSLVDAATFFIEQIGCEQVKSLIFQRKNEYRSYLQKSNFEEDVKRLKNDVKGTSMRFGKIHGHHNLLFYTTNDFEASREDATSEFLMYDMESSISSFLMKEGLESRAIRSFLKLETILPGFEIDDFVFTPYGYSLNAIKGNSYYTIHITPQETSAYVSFETNLTLAGKNGILKHFIKTLRPSSFDVMTFNEDLSQETTLDFSLLHHSQKKLTTGYFVDFKSYYKVDLKIEKPHLYGEG